MRSARVTPQACLRHDGGGSGAAKLEIWLTSFYFSLGFAGFGAGLGVGGRGAELPMFAPSPNLPRVGGGVSGFFAIIEFTLEDSLNGQ